MTLAIGQLRAEPGQKTCGSLTGGVHGGEFIGVDAATRLAGLLEPDDAAGQLVICPVATPSRPSAERRQGATDPRPFMGRRSRK